MTGVSLGADDLSSPHLEHFASNGHFCFSPGCDDDPAVQRTAFPNHPLDSGINHLRQTGRFHEQISSHSARDLQNSIREILFQGVHMIVRAKFQRHLRPVFLGFGDDHLGCACPLEDGASCQTNRTTAQNDHAVSRSDAAAAFDHRVVCHAGRLHQAAGNEQVLFRVILSQRFQAPDCPGGHHDVLGKGAVDVKTNLVQPLAMVWPAIRAGLALSAPKHFLRGHGFAALKGFVGAFVESFPASLDHHA